MYSLIGFCGLNTLYWYEMIGAVLRGQPDIGHLGE